MDLVAFAGFPGGIAGDEPEVLVRDGSGNPVRGITVKFTVTAGGGSVANATTTSGPEGRASAGKWTLGPAVGLNTLVGSVDGVGSVQFTARTIPVPTGTFQLTTIDGARLPLFLEPSSSDRIVGGTFKLALDRTCTYVLRTSNVGDQTVVESTVSGGFAPRSPGGLSFLIDARPWADGAVQGNTLVIYIFDLSDFIHAYVFVRETS